MGHFQEALPESADVVIVGAGSAGCVIARRLADAGVDVLLLEVGPPDEEPMIFDPLKMFDLWAGEGGLDWGYETVPQEHLYGRRIPQTRGKVLGGCSSINAMYHVRALPADYDTWAYLGNEGWRYEDVLPLFVRSEDFDAGASGTRGAGGPLHVVSEYDVHPLFKTVIAAVEEAGIQYNPDYNSGQMRGIAPIQLDIKNGERLSAARAFIHPALDNPHLSVRTGCHARRLLFEGERCVGVELERGGSVTQVMAQSEVVVSAGVFDSPKLLMLSGIGPAEELAEHGIESVLDLPGVGRNLQDHFFGLLVYSSKQPVPPELPGLPSWHVHMFLDSREGLPGPDLQSIMGPFPYYPEGYEGPENGFSFTSMINRPAARGTVRLASADPGDAPLIDPRYGSCPADLDAIASGLGQLRELLSGKALDQWRDEEICPGPDVQTREQLHEYIRRTTSSLYHMTSTCKMGIDEMAVVDPRLRVYGVEGLRVADASVMPMITTGNTHVPTTMIAERAADNVLAGLGVLPAAISES